jgi:glutathione S-transferase
LARSYPKAKLLPGDPDGDARVIELMDYVIGTLHGQGFTRIFTTDRFTPNEADFETVKAQGLDIVKRGFAVVNDGLSPQGYAMGAFTIADTALFYVEFWADKLGISLPDNCLNHYRLMLKRPAVRRVLMEEGYRLD